MWMGGGTDCSLRSDARRILLNGWIAWTVLQNPLLTDFQTLLVSPPVLGRQYSNFFDNIVAVAIFGEIDFNIFVWRKIS